MGYKLLVDENMLHFAVTSMNTVHESVLIEWRDALTILEKKKIKYSDCSTSSTI